jgi:hypothetical protein
VKATTEGVVRLPSAFSSTKGSPPSMTAMQELVVPRSIPSILAIKVVTCFEFSIAINYFQKRTIRVEMVFLYGVKSYDRF